MGVLSVVQPRVQQPTSWVKWGRWYSRGCSSLRVGEGGTAEGAAAYELGKVGKVVQPRVQQPTSWVGWGRWCSQGCSSLRVG